MEKKDSHYRDQFCRTMIQETNCNTQCLISSTTNELSYYVETERPEVIVKLTNHARKILLKSEYRDLILFPDIESNLYHSLEEYFNHNITCNNWGVLHCKSPVTGKYNLHLAGGILIENALQGFCSKKTHFNFASLAFSKPLIHYLAYSNLYIELNRWQGRKIPGAITCPVPGNAPQQDLMGRVFIEDGLALFWHLNDKYLCDDHCPKTKYSNIHRFLKYENKLAGNQVDYMNFINQALQVGITRILRPGFKYEDMIFPLMGRLKSAFDKNR